MDPRVSPQFTRKGRGATVKHKRHSLAITRLAQATRLHKTYDTAETQQALQDARHEHTAARLAHAIDQALAAEGDNALLADDREQLAHHLLDPGSQQ